MIFTEAGFWNPLLWMLSLLIILVIVLAIRSRGQKRYRHGTKQTLPFFSGNVAPAENVRSGNLYWGLFQATRRYYNWLIKAHTGIVNDYMFGFVALIVNMLIAVTLGGAL